MVEIRADIGTWETAIVHVMNTGGTAMSFSLDVTGEVKARQGEQPLSSSGCNLLVRPGEECIGVVGFFPLSAGDRSVTLTIHPSDASLADTTVPVLARTYTHVTTHAYPGLGTVTSSSPDVPCTQWDCAGHFLGTLTLTATPDPGNVFVGWTDGICGTSPTCALPPSTLRRGLGASFASMAAGQVTIDMTGTPPGTLVNVEHENGLDVRAVCSANCVVPLPSDVQPTPQIWISVDTPRGTTAITGACSGAARCSFAAAANASIVVRSTFDPKLPRTSVFELGALRSVARGANGDVFTSTLINGSENMWLVKLNAAGNVVWARHTTGQLIATANGGVAVSFPDSGNFVMQRMAAYDADGYQVRLEVNQDVYTSPIGNDEVDHFARTLALGANDVVAMPGTKNTLSAIEGWGLFGQGIHWNNAVSGAGARSITSNSAGVFYLATQVAGGSVSATKFDATGATLGTIPGVAYGAPLVMAVSAGGDVITTSGSAADISLRRVTATGTLVFERTVPLVASYTNRAGVVVLPNDDVFWIHGTRGQFGGAALPTGIVAERVSPTGTVVWSLTQRSWLDTGGNVEVFDVNIGGGVPVAAGGFQSTALGMQSWVGTFAP